VARRGRSGRGAGKGKRITELLKPGQEILVQAIKDPLKTKGPRLSMQLSIAGRYLVYVPQGEGVGVSRRLEDKERERLRRAVGKVDLGQGGVIVRTAAQGAKREDFEREIKYLHKLHDVLQQRGKETQAPEMVFQEADLSVRVARDIFSGEFEKAIVDDQKQHHRLESFFNRTAPELLERLESYDDKDEPLFEKYGVEDAFQSVLKRRVDLPSGGYLMIDYAEAMTVIDVNSGSFTGRGKGAKLEDTITKTNLEAAEQVVRQLRLRDIGGIIVIDFIDMARARNRDTVLKTLRKSLDEDRTKTYVVEISPLGLVEMTRQNVTDGVREIMTKPCPVCEGEGVVLSEETVAIEVDRWLRDLAAERRAPAFLIRVHPKVASILVGGHGVEGPIHEIEQETGRHFHFEGTEALPIDHFEVVLEGTADEIEERALPFREGEEVLVHIEEPHMYNEDDAVAKLDGYVVSVFGAAPLVGEKTLVRIEKVGRSAAQASLVNPPEGVSAAAASGSASTSPDGSDGRRRRRGRRGGRGRRKKTESGSSSS
jgi:ribonuclease G